jgi:hypothetical protein
VAGYSALAAVSTAVFGALNVSDYLTLSPGGVRDDIVQGTGYPVTLYVVQERHLGGIGSAPGSHRTLEMSIRLHVFTNHGGWNRAHTVMTKAIELLKTAPAVTGFGSWAIFHDETVPIGSQTVAGVIVNELVANFRLYVTET